MRAELGDQCAKLSDEQVAWECVSSKASTIIPAFAMVYSLGLLSDAVARNDSVLISLGCIYAQSGLGSIIDGTVKNIGTTLRSKLKSRP